MTVIKLYQFGRALTGREFGSDVMKGLATHVRHPVCVDFEGVEAMGSPFGDEVIAPLAAKQQGKIIVKNANETIISVLKDVAADAGIEIEII